MQVLIKFLTVRNLITPSPATARSRQDHPIGSVSRSPPGTSAERGCVRRTSRSTAEGEEMLTPPQRASRCAAAATGAPPTVALRTCHPPRYEPRFLERPPRTFCAPCALEPRFMGRGIQNILVFPASTPRAQSPRTAPTATP